MRAKILISLLYTDLFLYNEFLQAPFETRHHMDNCIKVLCNANVGRDFKIGKDMTLPEVQVRKMEDPLRDLGGKPPKKRSILAFFAGGMHGYLRPILLWHWKNDPDMKISGELPRVLHMP